MENLNIRITAQSQDAESAISEVNQNLGELSATAEIADDQVEGVNEELRETSPSAAMAAGKLDDIKDLLFIINTGISHLERQLNELNDELRETGAAGAVGATGLNAVALSSRRASAGIALFHAASLPLVATVGALTAGLLGLATVFGALGLAAVAVGASELKAEFAGIKSELIAAVKPLAEDFLPLLKAAINALPELARNLVDAIGDTTAFRRALAQFGRLAMQVLPDLVAGVTGFARVLLPFLKAAGPLLVVLAEGFRVVGEVAGTFGEVLNSIPYSGIALGITGIWLALAPISGTITTIVTALGLLSAAWQSDFLGIRSTVLGLLADVQNLLSTLQNLAGQTYNAVVDIAFQIAQSVLGPPGAAEQKFVGGGLAALDPTRGFKIKELDGLLGGGGGGGGGGGVNVNVRNINASSRQEGKEAAKGLNNTLNRELRGTARLPNPQRGG